MEFTENFNFRKPSQEDFYNIDDFNKNVDLIDMQLKKFEDTKLEADSDISKNIIKSLDNVSSEFPTITAGDTAKGALGKIKKFIDDFNKIRSALVMVGSIVDNSVTDRKDLAVSARQVMLLAQQNAALNNSLNNKPAISAFLGSLFVKSKNEYEKLPLSSSVSKGTGLSLQNGNIVIGAGVRHVLVSAQVYFFNNITLGSKDIDILVNNTLLARSYNVISDNYKHFSVSTRLCSVSENNTISIHIQGRTGDEIQAYNHGTFLTVVAV